MFEVSLRLLEVIKGHLEVKIQFQHNLDMSYVFRNLGLSRELIYWNFKDLSPFEVVRGHKRLLEVKNEISHNLDMLGIFEKLRQCRLFICHHI